MRVNHSATLAFSRWRFERTRDFRHAGFFQMVLEDVSTQRHYLKLKRIKNEGF
jgi:hypothetical protein